MATKIITKNSSTATSIPTAGDLVQGELAVNVTDKRLFTEDSGGAIVELGTNPSTLTSGAATFSGTVTADGLTVDGIPTATGDARYEVVISEDQTASAGRGGGIAFARQGDILGGIKNTLDATASNSQMSFQTRLSGTVATKMTLDASGNLLVGKTAFDDGATKGFTHYSGSGDSATFSTRSSNPPLNLNRLNSDGEILRIRKDGVSVGSIGTNSSYTYIAGNNSGAGNGSGLNFGTSIEPTNRLGGVHNGITDLGTSSNRFKDLYLSGGVSTNTTTGLSITADSSNRGILNLSTSTAYQLIGGSYYGYTGYKTGGYHRWFGSDGNEDMRIDASGNLLVGTTESANARLRVVGSAVSQPLVQFVSDVLGDLSSPALYLIKKDNNASTAQNYVRFVMNGGAIASGQINGNGAGAVAFGTWSDVTLKENIVDLSDQYDNIKALRPVEFDYIEAQGGGHQTGFIAQEMQEVYPCCVSEDLETGKLTISGWSKTEARLVSALQSAMNKIEALTARIEALEGA